MLPSKLHTLQLSQPVLTPLHYNPQIIDLLDNLYYRQSMLKDYKTCPQMFLYRWIIQHEGKPTFFSAILGTAGHKVIQQLHEEQNFDLSHVELTQYFSDALHTALEQSSTLPAIQKQFDTLSQQCTHYIPEYVEMLRGYSSDENNREFHISVVEQTFVLQLQDEFSRQFIFTGQIDQAGYYNDGTYALRDAKFRDNAFKPSKTELDLDIQLSLYAYALRNGVPSCPSCAPTYSHDGQLIYAGPCEVCNAKISTAAWPKLVAGRCELIWMRDYEKRKRDQHAHYIISETEKELNPKTGRMIKAKRINPDWINGFKKGDNAGSGHIVSESRTQAFLQVHIADIIRLAGMIRDGRFYRNAGNHCNFWCQHKEACLSLLETEVDEIDTSKFAEYMSTADPFVE